MKTHNIVLYTLCFMTAGTTTVARADEDDTSPQSTITVGIGAQNAPRYSGSDKRTTQVMPLIQARYGAFFLDSQQGIGYDLMSDNGLYLEHTLGYTLGRSDKDASWREGSDKLKGMGNINAAVNTSIAVGWTIAPWISVEGKIALPLSDGQGGQYRTSFTLIPIQNDSDTLAWQTAALFGDHRYMNTFYGVNKRQSARSGYHRFNAAGGFYGVDTSLTWSHQFSEHWGTSFSAGYTWLGDHAADSPIVFRRNQVTGAAAITYTF
ncbi:MULTISPECIES: MipA/OmpV family protein [unclassified Brenneria]|uniref:MipA/OmpV family protein n=1 Tax=unclassified Brenneria TaxID=2634434 RepID=UPI0029C4D34D|nr:MULTISPECIES: MipA/OmpV family protein [unclassified Brenneria]MDX5630513.1 MipA/OmpV family protein [Brenneria sp. L3-3Z]MDX5697678.1 MipA/OmpV family protein [Brenneria sp. L4-2C]